MGIIFEIFQIVYILDSIKAIIVRNELINELTITYLDLNLNI